MGNNYIVYQIIDHPTLIKKLREKCVLELNDSDVKSISKLRDIGDCLYELTSESMKGLSKSISVLELASQIDDGASFAIDLKETSN